MAQPERTTEEIVRDLKQGRDSKENFRLLYHRYSGPIRNFFEKKGVTEGEELKNDVFLAVYHNVGTLQEESKFEYWLFSIARNKYKNWLKQTSTKRRVEVSLSGGDGDVMREIDASAPQVVNAETHLLEKEKIERVWEVMQELPDQKRLIAVLAWVDGRSPKEIGSLLSININTVYVHLHQTQKIVGEKLGRYFENAPGSRRNKPWMRKRHGVNMSGRPGIHVPQVQTPILVKRNWARITGVG